MVLIATLSTAPLACGDAPTTRPPPEPAAAWTPERTRAADAHARRLASAPPAAPGALSFHLAYGADADLDLYVTGPDEETIYYANTPGKAGGALVEDKRCAHDGPRIETVLFPAPLAAGRYRVGVDYPHACGDESGPAPFVVEIVGPDGRVEERGLARHRVFEPVVVELDVERGVEAGPEVAP